MCALARTLVGCVPFLQSFQKKKFTLLKFYTFKYHTLVMPLPFQLNNPVRKDLIIMQLI